MTAPATARRPEGGPPGVKNLLTSGLARACYYAGTRPDCQVLAAVRYGQLALCATCDQRRSTLGKGIVPAALPPGPAVDVLHWVAQSCLAAGQASRDLDAAVTRARSAGCSWATIATQMGIGEGTARRAATL